MPDQDPLPEEGQSQPPSFEGLLRAFDQAFTQREASAELRQAANQAFEIFTALTEAGFTEEQALSLMIGSQHR